MAFLIPKHVVICGDTLFRDSVGRTDLPGGSQDVLGRSLGESLWDLDDAVAVLPGHGATSTIAREKQSNWLFQDLVRAFRGQEPLPRPWMGIRFDTAFAGPGIRLSEVSEGTPAAKAGLQVGDVVLVFDGTKIASGQDLVGVIRRHKVGDTVAMTRKGNDIAKRDVIRPGSR